MPTEDIYTEEIAANMCKVALRDFQCAELLNTLASGGTVTWEDYHGRPRLVFISGEMFAKFMEESGFTDG